MTLLDEVEGTTPTTTHKPRVRIAAVALLITTVVATAGYGFAQHQHGVTVTEQRDRAVHTLAATRATQHETQRELSKVRDDYAASRSDLSTAEDQLDTCADVAKATNELFESTDSLLTALINYPDGLDEIDKADKNIDRVTALVDKGGFDSIDEMLDTCKGTNGTGI